MAAEKTLSTSCFKAYDIRGRVPDEFNEELACRLGRPLSALVDYRLPLTTDATEKFR